MNRAIVVTALALVAVTATASAASAGEEGTRTKVRVVQLRHDGEATAATLADIQGDRVKIEDLDTLLPGETRSYYTESGREVLVTRGEGDRYTVEVEGRKVEIGGSVDELLAAHAGTAGGKRRVVIHRAEEKGEGTSEVTEDHTEVIAGGDL